VQRNHVHDFWLNFMLGVLLQQRAPEEASGYLIVALSQRPDNGAVRNALGNAFYFRRDFERAQIEFCEACRLLPDRVWHHGNYIHTLLKLEKASEAERVCRGRMKLFPRDAMLTNLFAQALAMQDKSSEAEQAFREAIRLDPADGDYYIGFARFCMRQDKWGEAQKVLQDAVQLNLPPSEHKEAARLLRAANSKRVRNDNSP
jgi:predicted Zn-dependent protease